ncbi:MAG: nitroreductase family protein [Turicibacter sp.]|nr:nitroreductase family protein [Turicibacter sp.]
MSKFKEIVLKNRSYRGYDNDVTQTKEDLLDLVDHARLMPAAKNAQPLKYFLAYEKEVVAQIQAHTKWAGLLAELNLPFEGTKPTSFIVILQDTDIEPVLAQFQTDAGIAAATITLAAAEKGLGCCMIGAYSAAGVKAVMQLPENLSPVLVIAIGKPAEKIVLTDVEDNKVAYYRDEDNVHYVPKRKLADIVVN